MMEFVSKTKPKPYRIERIDVPNSIKVLDNGDLVVVETERRKVFLSIKEANIAIKGIDEKIRFFEFEISKEYIERVKRDIKQLEKQRDLWIKAISSKMEE